MAEPGKQKTMFYPTNNDSTVNTLNVHTEELGHKNMQIRSDPDNFIISVAMLTVKSTFQKFL